MPVLANLSEGVEPPRESNVGRRNQQGGIGNEGKKETLAHIQRLGGGRWSWLQANAQFSSRLSAESTSTDSPVAGFLFCSKSTTKKQKTI